VGLGPGGRMTGRSRGQRRGGIHGEPAGPRADRPHGPA
jgi:hypothetical protein